MPPMPRHYLHIVPVGTSLLLNSGFKHGQKLPRWQDLRSLLDNGNPRALSAELNGLLPFVESGQCTSVHLVATSTPECQLCRRAIESFLQRRGVHLSRLSAQHLLPSTLAQATDQADFNHGIRQFRQAIFGVVAKARERGETVMMNATGGLKAEVIIAALVAAQLRVPAYYIHESMKQPVFLPLAPLDPDFSAHLRQLGKSHRPRDIAIPPDVLQHLEFEGYIKLQRRADGSVSTIRLTPYGRYWAQQS